MVHLTEFAGLFAVAFLAATVLPAQSEILLAGMVLTEHYPAWALVAVASLGNVLGSVVNWVLGRFIAASRGGAGSRSPASRSPRPRAGITAGASGPCCSPGRRSSAIR
jgi:membrane protein YqaA with SNARE-associated domain